MHAGRCVPNAAFEPSLGNDCFRLLWSNGRFRCLPAIWSVMWPTIRVTARNQPNQRLRIFLKMCAASKMIGHVWISRDRDPPFVIYILWTFHCDLPPLKSATSTIAQSGWSSVHLRSPSSSAMLEPKMMCSYFVSFLILAKVINYFYFSRFVNRFLCFPIVQKEITPF